MAHFYRISHKTIFCCVWRENRRFCILLIISKLKFLLWFFFIKALLLPVKSIAFMDKNACFLSLKPCLLLMDNQLKWRFLSIFFTFLSYFLTQVSYLGAVVDSRWPLHEVLNFKPFFLLSLIFISTYWIISTSFSWSFFFPILKILLK